MHTRSASASSPLRVHPTNPRYFADGNGNAVYLTGSHTWGNFVDFLTGWPPFDYPGYLDFLDTYNHNFIRLWSGYTMDMTPSPYARTGPGTALDGQPKLDLNSFNQAFFDRLRSRVIEAGNRGIYVGVMLFRPDGVKSEDIALNIFNAANNIQGVNGDPNGDQWSAETYNLSNPQITAYQEAYASKVIDTLNDLDNVIYEIGNEGDWTSIAWQYHFINFIKNYEAGKPKQHLVGMTSVFNILDGSWSVNNTALFNSNADWISPGGASYRDNPPASNGSKIIIADVDHIWPSEPASGWIWESFLRGHHPILLDWYTYGSPTWTTSAEQEKIRKYMGYTLTYAMRMNLAAMTPQNSLSSTQYALAHPGNEYLIYQPSRANFTVNLQAGSYTYEWFNPRTGSIHSTGSFSAATGNRRFNPPFNSESVLYVKVAALLR